MTARISRASCTPLRIDRRCLDAAIRLTELRSNPITKRRLYPAVPGVEIDGEALDRLALSEVCDEYLERVRMPQMAAVSDALLTVRHFRYGGEPLTKGATGNPIIKASSTLERVHAMSETPEWAHSHMAVNAKSAVNCRSLATHVRARKARTHGYVPDTLSDVLSTRNCAGRRCVAPKGGRARAAHDAMGAHAARTDSPREQSAAQAGARGAAAALKDLVAQARARHRCGAVQWHRDQRRDRGTE